MNALRGHSNIQGLTDVGLLSNQMPGYLALPTDRETTFADYMKTRQFKPLRPGQVSYWQNYGKFFVSFQKAVYGDAARADNDWAYDWLPKLDVSTYDIIRAFEMMANGEMNGYLCQGFNPLQAFPDRGKIRRGLGKLKFLVTMIPWIRRPRGSGRTSARRNPSNPADIQTEVFQLPTSCFAEENGSLVNSSRWLQWHWKAAGAPGQARSDIWIMTQIFHRMREMYRKEGGAFPDPILNMTWNYTDPTSPDPEELAKDMNGRALVDLKDANGATIVQAGKLLDGFAQLRDDGTTALRLLDLLGLLYREGQSDGAARCHRSARAGHRLELGVGLAGQPAHHVQPRQRRSRGKPWNPKKPVIEWDGKQWTGIDVPDYTPTTKPFRWGRPLHHERGGRRTPVRARPDGRWPIPRALRALRVAFRECPASEGAHQSCSAGFCR